MLQTLLAELQEFTQTKSTLEFQGVLNNFHHSRDLNPNDSSILSLTLTRLRSLSFGKNFIDRFLAQRKTLKQSHQLLVTTIVRLLDENISASSIRASLSHTSNACIAIACEKPTLATDCFCIGVDIEESTRTVSDRVAVRFFRKSEEKFNLTALEAWVIKEAAFKAYTHNKGTVVSDYEIIHYDQKNGVALVHLKNNLKKEIRFKLCHHHEGEKTWLIAFAKYTET